MGCTYADAEPPPPETDSPRFAPKVHQHNNLYSRHAPNGFPEFGSVEKRARALTRRAAAHAMEVIYLGAEALAYTKQHSDAPSRTPPCGQSARVGKNCMRQQKPYLEKYCVTQFASAKQPRVDWMRHVRGVDFLWLAAKPELEPNKTCCCSRGAQCTSSETVLPFARYRVSCECLRVCTCVCMSNVPTMAYVCGHACMD